MVFSIQWCCRLCEKNITCQNQGSLTHKTKTELHSIPAPTGVNNYNLPEVDGYCCLTASIYG